MVLNLRKNPFYLTDDVNEITIFYETVCEILEISKKTTCDFSTFEWFAYNYLQMILKSERSKKYYQQQPNQITFADFSCAYFFLNQIWWEFNFFTKFLRYCLLYVDSSTNDLHVVGIFEFAKAFISLSFHSAHI